MTNEYEHLNEIQKIGLDILKEIIAVCKRHDLYGAQNETYIED